MSLNKLKILITLTPRTLTEAEAGESRNFVTTLRPKVHLVLPDWPWLEARGLSESAATQLVEHVREIAPHCRVSGLTSQYSNHENAQSQFRENPKSRQRESTPALFSRGSVTTAANH
jgi:hypothetical protein